MNIKDIIPESSYFHGEERLIFDFLFKELPFDQAVQMYGDSPILWKFFEKKESPNKLLYLASQYNHYPLALRAIELGADDFESAMENAAIVGNMEMLRGMIRRGADNFDTALRHAASNGHLEMVNGLLRYGPDGANEAMAFAARNGHRRIIDELIKYGANDWYMAKVMAERGGHRMIAHEMEQRMGRPSFDDLLDSLDD
jgi:hypothetical protein